MKDKALPREPAAGDRAQPNGLLANSRLQSKSDFAAFISLGANLGDREATLVQALRALADEALPLSRFSGIYETEPVGAKDQPDFLNMVAEISPAKAPLALLQRLQIIEQRLGRVRHERWGARTIDLDLLCIEGISSWRDEKLVLPHPRLHHRRFVLVPFAEIAPDFFISAIGATVSELLQTCKDPHAVRLYRRAADVHRFMRKAQS